MNIEICENVVKMHFKNGKVALYDYEDFDRVSKQKWHCSTNDYVQGRILNSKNEWKSVYLHRFIMKAIPGQYLDHINRNPLDNRKSNLRFCTRRQNQRNTKSKNGNRKGVTKKFNKYRANIWDGKKSIYLGYFNTELEAAKAYNDKAVEIFGEFACLNDLTDN